MPIDMTVKMLIRERMARRDYSGRIFVKRSAGRPATAEGKQIHRVQSALLRPGRGDAVHAGVGDELAHVLVGVDDDAEIHSVGGGVAISDVDFAMKVGSCCFRVSLLYDFERALEPADDFGLGGHRSVHSFFVIGGELRPSRYA